MKKLLLSGLLPRFLLAACGREKPEPPAISCEILREEGAPIQIPIRMPAS